MKIISIGVLRETKNPPDRRVPLTPEQCSELSNKYGQLELQVQPSELRCHSDQEYLDAGVELREDLGECDILLGVKEVKVPALIADKRYVFFSHTAKEQPYNRGLLQAVVEKNISLVDYEYLTNESGVRVVAFGRWAGVVGAYNGLRALGLRSGRFELPPAASCRDLKEMKKLLKGVDAGRTRMVLTGGGRVAGGALEVLKAAGIKQVEPEAYLAGSYERSVFTRLDPWHYTRNRFREQFDFKHFMENPHLYENRFLPYARRSDMFVACHFWDPRSPVMLSQEDLRGGSVPIRVVADISCDIEGPIASTLRASTIAEPFYGYEPVMGEETEAFREDVITVMAVDNLPGELPRDASRDFGKALMENVIPELLGELNTGMIKRASITGKGGLTKNYAYLREYLEGKG